MTSWRRKSTPRWPSLRPCSAISTPARGRRGMHPTMASSRHTRHATAYEHLRNGAVNEEFSQQSCQHDEETTERAYEQDQRNRTIEGRFAQLAHAEPPVNRCTHRCPAR